MELGSRDKPENDTCGTLSRFAATAIQGFYASSFALRRRSALAMTLTEDSDIAAAGGRSASATTRYIMQPMPVSSWSAFFF